MVLSKTAVFSGFAVVEGVLTMSASDPSSRVFKVVGQRPLRPDGLDKVIGRALYGADLSVPGMLVGRILRSPHAHARIRSIDTSAAESLSGVKAIITAADFADVKQGDVVDEDLTDILHNCMAHEKALYDGHAIAAVAAVSATVAQRALALLEVDYEILPHVIDVDEAMQPHAPLLHEERGDRDRPIGMSANVTGQCEFGHGDVDVASRPLEVLID